MKKLFKKIGVFMLMLILPLSLIACGGSKEPLVWDDIVLKDLLPKIESEDCDIITNDDESLYVSLNDKSESEGKAYKRECVEFGYTIDADEDSYGYEAYNEDGAHLSLSYISGLTIDLEAPLKMGNIKWPNSDIAKLIPQPESLYGKIEWEADYGFVIYIGNTTLSQYSDYVDAVWNAGFNLDYNRGDDYFWADNADGYQVEVRYKGFNTMWIRLDEPDTDDDGGSTDNPPVSSNKIELTKSSSDFDGKLYTEVTEDLQDMGFSNIEYEIIYDLTTGWLVSDGEIETVSIDGDTDFDKGDEYYKDSEIIITYHTFKSNKPSDDPTDDPNDNPPISGEIEDTYDDNYVGTKYKVRFYVDFIANLFLDKFDVDFRIDGRKFETLTHGTDGEFEYELKPGKHIIAFSVVDDTSINGQIELNVEKNTYVFYQIQTHSDVIDLTQTDIQYPNSTPDPVAEIYEYCWERVLSNYTCYILLDNDTNTALSVVTNDTFVLEGTFTGTFDTGWTINYVYGNENWNETLVKKSSTTATLTDGNGYNWSYTLGKVKDGEEYLRKIGYLEPLTVLELPSSYTDYDGMNYYDVTKDLKDAGFTNISYNVIYDLTTGLLVSDGEIESVSINGTTAFKKGDVHYADTEIIITYHTFEKNNPALNEGKVKAPISSDDARDYYYWEVRDMFIEAGFTNVKVTKMYESSIWGYEQDKVAYVRVEVANGTITISSADNMYDPDQLITIQYYEITQSGPSTTELSKYYAKKAFEEFGEAVYDYGFEVHWSLGLEDERQNSDGSWYFEVNCTITTVYGTTFDTIVSATVDGSDADAYVAEWHDGVLYE